MHASSHALPTCLILPQMNPQCFVHKMTSKRTYNLEEKIIAIWLKYIVYTGLEFKPVYILLDGKGGGKQLKYVSGMSSSGEIEEGGIGM